MYSTKNDILNQIDEETLIELTDDDKTGVVNETVLNANITDADSEINSYLEGNYTIPLSPVPARIRSISVDITIYNLYSRRDDTIPEIRKERYENAMKYLEAVSKGEINLGTSAIQPTTTPDTAVIESQTRKFTRETMSGF
jgi:phage gp36-like protein